MTAAKPRPKTNPTALALEPAAPFAPPSIEAAKELIDKLVKEELQENWTEDKIRQRIRSMLQHDFNHIVKISLGFSKSSYRDEWEVDHCNGRGGNSEVTAQISAVAKTELSKVIQEGINEGKFVLGKSEIAALQKQFREYINGYEARDQIRALAKRRVDRLVDILEGHITGADE